MGYDTRMSSGTNEADASSSVVIKYPIPIDGSARVVVLACGRDAYAETALAVRAGNDVYAGRSAALFPVEDDRPLRHRLTSTGPGIFMLLASPDQLRQIGEAWRQMCFPSKERKPPHGTTYLDAIPDELDVTHVECQPGWNAFDVEVIQTRDEVEVRVASEVTGPTYSAMEAYPTWENSDPLGRLLDELDVDSDELITIPERIFTIGAFAVPLAGAFTLLAVIDFSVAVTVFGVLLGLAIAPSWERYAQAVENHRKQAREQRNDPTVWLIKSSAYLLLGVAVHRWVGRGETFKQVTYSGSVTNSSGPESPEIISRPRHVKIRRPRFFWDRFIARRWAIWWSRRVRTVHGSYPPEHQVTISRNPLYRPIDHLGCRWVLWRVGRLLIRHNTSTTEAHHTIDRFMRNATWRVGPRNRHDMQITFTSHGAAGLLAGLFVATGDHEGWPPSRTREPDVVPIVPRQL